MEKEWEMRISAKIVLLASMLLCLLSGCITREITYSIGADQSAFVHFVARGDKADILQGDLMPPKDSWTVKESEITKPDGKKEYIYEATKSFAHVSDIPPNFATSTTRFPNAYLQTPIQFRVESKPDATYYEFTLTYKARRYKEYQDLLWQIAGPDLAEQIKQRGADKLTEQEQIIFLTVLLRWQAQLERDRIAAALQKESQSGSLPAQKVQEILQRLDATFEKLVDEKLARKIMALPEEQRGKALDEEKVRAHAEGDRILQEALAAQHGAVLKKVRDTVAEATLEWEITNDLGDENYVVTVNMPGNIVKTNAEKYFGNRAEWRFNGEKFRDSDYVLSVTSKIAR